MGKRKDLTGNRFGRLVVIEKTTGRTRNGNIKWKCLCDCGKEAFVSTTSLNSENTKSCGCLNNELSEKRFASVILKHGDRKSVV